ncbi:MAG: LamG domain-containing protein [Planctomycetota bacterium]
MPVVPRQWLVGPPPSELSAVTIPEDHWVDLLFSGGIVSAGGDDLELTEAGKAGEQAIIFLTDGVDREYVVGMAQAETAFKQGIGYINLDFPGIEVPFTPRGLRLVAVDFGGLSPGFDLGSARVRVSHECGPQARFPTPVAGAVGVPVDANLVWTPACETRRQCIYLSEIESLVEAGDSSVRHWVRPPDGNSFEPPVLQLGRTYHWRVDNVSETDANDVLTGELWSFTVVDRLAIDDFDRYNGWTGPFLHETWSARSRGRVSLESEHVFRSCRQSLVFYYYYDAVYHSDAFRHFHPPQDWAEAGAAGLRLWLHGGPGNATSGQMYLTLSDGHVEQIVPFQGDADILTRSEWTPWRVSLSEFTDVNLASVESLTVGFSWPSAEPGQYGDGTVYIDDITLCPPLCIEGRRPDADVTYDCTVDYDDLEQLAAGWLADTAHAVAIVAPNEPILWYPFDGNAEDSSGLADGQIQGRPTYAPGVYGQAIYLLNRGDAVTVPDAAEVFADIRSAMTIVFWQKGDDSAHLNDTLCCSNYAYGVSNPSIAVHLGCWRNPGRYRWDCGTPWSFENRLAGGHRTKDEWAGRWNHWVFTKDTRVGPESDKGMMRIYRNGVLYDSRSGTNAPIEEITSFTVGSGWYGGYDGLIDDFRIYDYALSEPEVAYLASDGTGQFIHPNGLPADLDGSNRVDLRDFAILADQWLSNQLWP